MLRILTTDTPGYLTGLKSPEHAWNPLNTVVTVATLIAAMSCAAFTSSLLGRM